MIDTWIRDNSGKPYARIRTEKTGFQKIYEPSGRYLGLYNPTTDTTVYPNGTIFCRGNALTSLVNFN